MSGCISPLLCDVFKMKSYYCVAFPLWLNAVSPRWQHIYIVAMDTTSITLCVAFSDLQIKEESVMMMSGQINCVFHKTSKNVLQQDTWYMKSQFSAVKDVDWQNN